MKNLIAKTLLKLNEEDYRTFSKACDEIGMEKAMKVSDAHLEAILALEKIGAFYGLTLKDVTLIRAIAGQKYLNEIVEGGTK